MASASSEGPTPTPSVQTAEALNAKELEALTSAVTMLQRSFAVDERGNKKEPTQEQTTTMADVADKVVSLGARAIAQAADSVEKVAPRVWGVMVRQQYAKAIGDLTVPSIGFLITLIIFLRTKAYRIRCWSTDSRVSTEEFFFAVLIVALVMITALWLAYALSNSVMYLINPEFYAFRDLLVMILNKGQGL
ncbi:MAG: hypothetical protein KBC02_02135 [Candidatus Pacebacteria bacterium]|nr:hypothetical protein [Candidatus Paceibacterota bacterium]